MAMTTVTPNIFVDDVGKTVDWYRDVLGFKFDVGVIEGTEDSTFEYTGQSLGFAIMSHGDVQLMFQSRGSVAVDLPGIQPASGDAFALYIGVEDVDALYAKVSAQVDLEIDLRDTFYGAREFHFRDCNGTMVGLAQRPERG
ncbi:MAG: hypothetical protein GKS06_15195 [Acidobacteria bacterium]|nr:hypothetical protein [Acidobacteriota bacterium]